MASKRSPAKAREHPDYTKLPEPVDDSQLVETHDVDPDVHVPKSKLATPDIEDMARTGAIGFGF